MAKESREDREREFEAHIWDHAADPFQASFDLREDLPEEDMAALRTAVAVLSGGGTDEDLAGVFYEALSHRPEFGAVLLQLVGLTRNKIKVDLDAGAVNRKLGTRFPIDPTKLARRAEVWALAGPYLARRFRTVFGHAVGLGPEDIGAMMQSLNQATWLGFVRQRRAKLSGHEAEHRVALLFAGLGIPFEPKRKEFQPASPDAVLNGHSFDLVVPSVSDPKVCVLSGVQSSNIGQFGESKTQDLVNALEMLDDTFGSDRPLVLALIDGVGYRSNRAGLRKVLDNADEFAQFATLWKAGIVAASCTRLALKVALPPGEREQHAEFLRRYPDIEVLELTDKLLATIGDQGTIEAGEGLLILASG